MDGWKEREGKASNYKSITYIKNIFLIDLFLKLN